MARQLKLKFNRTYFAFPYAVIAVIFVVIPIILLAYMSFTDASGAWTFDNFVEFFGDSRNQTIMLRSLGVAMLTTVICLAIAYPVALILSNSKLNKSAILVLLFVLPMWINFLLRTYALKNLLGIIGIQNGMTAVVIGMVYDFFPFMLLPLYTILNNMDKSLVEASSDLGGGALSTFKKVVLPLSVPGIVSGALMVFMPTVSTFAITDMLGNTDTYLFGNIINDYFTSSYTWNLGSAFAFIMLILIAGSMLITNKFTKGSSTSGRSVI